MATPQPVCFGIAEEFEQCAVKRTCPHFDQCELECGDIAGRTGDFQEDWQ